MQKVYTIFSELLNFASEIISTGQWSGTREANRDYQIF